MFFYGKPLKRGRCRSLRLQWSSVSKQAIQSSSGECESLGSEDGDCTQSTSSLDSCEIEVSHDSSFNFGSLHKQNIRNLLCNEGLGKYLTQSLGGGLNATSVRTLVLRIADLLMWTYAKHTKQMLQEADVLLWMKEFILKKFKLIAPYVEYLQQDKGRTPATILHTLNDIKKGVIWFLSFRRDENDCDIDEDVLAIQRTDIDPLFHIIKSISRQMTKHLRRERSADPKNTLSGIVFQRHLPVTGLKGLVENLREQMVWLTPFMEKMKTNDYLLLFDKEIYDLYMQTLYASMYVFSPQGRVGGIADLNCKQGIEMLKYGYTQSNAFKTSGTYGYQPVLVADISCALLEHYVLYLRPKVSGASTDSTPTSPLWIKYNGKRAKNYDISHNVTR